MTVVTFYESATRPESADEVESTWDQLAESLTSLEEGLRTTNCAPQRLLQTGDLLCTGKSCTAKDGPAWSPVRLKVPYRRDENVLEITYAVLDLDHLTFAQVEDSLAKLDGYEHVVHSTHGHEFASADDDNCLRVVLPLSRPVLRDEWRGVLRAIVATLNIPADPTCKDRSRLYYLPTTSKHVEYFARRGYGKVLDVEALLAAPEAKEPPVPVIGVTDVDDDEPEAADVDLNDLRKTVLNYRRRKKAKSEVDKYELMSRIVDGKPLADPGARQVTVHQAMSCLVWATKGAPWPAAFEVIRASLSAMDTAPEGLQYWADQAYTSYMRGLDDRADKLAAYDARMLAVRDRLLKSRTGLPQLPAIRKTLKPIQERLQRKKTQLTSAPEAAPASPPQVTASPQQNANAVSTAKASDEPARDVDGDDTDGEDVTPPWEYEVDGRLIMTTVKTAGGPPTTQPKSCGVNARTILNYDPMFRGNIRFNELSHDIEVIGGEFKDVNPEVLGTEVNNYLQARYSIDVGKLECESQILALAYENTYDPLFDYLDPLEAQWDGNERLQFFLEYFCDAPLVDFENRDISMYVRTISLKWFIGAVARALDPGCQMDNVLVLEGGQGDRKTSLLRRLFGAFFATSHLDITDKDTKMLASSTWGIELAELSSLKGSETEAQKAFFTILFDKYRAPYGRRLQNTPRRCVFVGTTNAAAYLTDSTGNRRYWPITCGPAMYDRQKELTDYVRNQLWAEAVVRFRRFQAARAEGVDADDNPEKWWLTKSEQTVANEQTESRMEETQSSIYQTKISDWYYSLVPGRRKRRLSTVEVAAGALGMTPDRITRSHATTIGAAMHDLGFVRRRKRDESGKQVWGYEALDKMFYAPTRGRGEETTMITPEPPPVPPTPPTPPAPPTPPTPSPPKPPISLALSLIQGGKSFKGAKEA